MADIKDLDSGDFPDKGKSTRYNYDVDCTPANMCILIRKLNELTSRLNSVQSRLEAKILNDREGAYKFR